MQESLDSAYRACVKTSEKAHWKLEDFDDIRLDFSRPFMPEDLARTEELTHLSRKERLRLNQIRGYAYAYLFRYVEEFIIRMLESIREEKAQGQRAVALEMFFEEEKKHQNLFLLFESRFRDGFPVPCEVIGNMQEVANALQAHTELSKLLFTAMLEWLTQSHYLAYFAKEGVAPLDEGFKELFRLHWIEEAQHARIDGLESLRIAATLDGDDCQRAVEEFLRICDGLKPLLRHQAELDIESLERVRGSQLDEGPRARTLEHQVACYHHTFIELGLRNHQFRKLLTKVSPPALAMVDAYLQASPPGGTS